MSRAHFDRNGVPPQKLCGLLATCGRWDGHRGQHGGFRPVVGWWHPAECSNEHNEHGNCVDVQGSVVGWREELK